MEGLLLVSSDRCPQCDGSYHVEDAPYGDGYQGFMVDGEDEPICKECVWQGVKNGTLNMTHVKSPMVGWFVVWALEHTNTRTPRMVTQSWDEVVALVDEPNRFRVAYVFEDLTCYGDYMVRALMGDGACNEYFWENDFWWQAYQEGITEFHIYANKRDREGHVLRLPDGLDYEEYEDRITDIVNPMVFANEKNYASSIFVGTYEESKVVPHMLLKPVYYYPETSMKWRTNLEDVERIWKDLEVMQPGQFTLERVTTPKKKKIKV